MLSFLEADLAVDIVILGKRAEFLIAHAAFWALEVPQVDYCRARVCHGPEAAMLRRVAASDSDEMTGLWPFACQRATPASRSTGRPE